MKNKAIRIFEYLRELKRLNSKVVWDLYSYGYDPIWSHDVPDAQGLKTIFQSENNDSDIWLEIRKQSLPKVPVPPSICRIWITDDSFNDHLNPPTLENRIKTNSSPDQFQFLNDNPNVINAFNTYLRDNWRPWAKKYAEKLPVYNLYNKLFEIHSTLRKEGEKVELILGMGLIHWVYNGQRIRKHLFVSSTQLVFDPHNGVISIRPAIDGAQTNFEFDVLQDILERDQINVINESLETINNVWDDSQIFPIINCLTNMLPESTFNPSMEYKQSFTEKPSVSFSPAFYLRKRGEIAWLKAFDTIIKSIEESGIIPESIKSLTDAKFTGDSPSSPQETNQPKTFNIDNDDIIYFPHASNDAQRKIINRIYKSHGVLVQGPPGTGKSHTIANLICHFLAIGKRILITSQTPRALQVLKNKLPTEFQGLCVSVLGNDPESLSNLNEAVQSINEKYANKPDKSSDDLHISDLMKDLNTIRKKISIAQSSILEISEKQYHKYTFGSYSGTLLELSQAITNDREKFKWMPEFEYISSEIPPESKDVIAFHDAAKKMTPDKVKELTLKLPSTDKLPEIDTFNQKVQEYHDANKIIDKNNAFLDHDLFPLIRRATKQQLENALNALNELESHLVLLRLDNQNTWLQTLKKDILIESSAKWQALFDETTQLLSYIDQNQSINELLKAEFNNQSGLDNLSLLNDVQNILSHYNTSNKLPITWSMLSAEGRRITRTLKQIRFNGQLINSKIIAETLKQYLILSKKITEVSKIWIESGHDIPKSLWSAVAELRSCSEQLKGHLETFHYTKQARQALSEIEASLVPDWLDESAFNTTQELIILGIQNILLDNCDKWFYEQQKTTQDFIDSGNIHHCCLDIINAFKTKDVKLYRQVLERFQSLSNEKNNYNWWKNYWAKLSGNNKLFFKYIRDNINNDEIDVQLSDWESGWHFASASAFLKYISSTDTLPKLQNDLSSLIRAESSVICELGAKKAWSSCIQNMKPDQIQYLRAWAQAVKRIGKGTGKYVNKHRQDAQEALNRCRSAIPAWVMPLYRVVESVKIEPNAFDVVIIDEASQSGPDSLILTYLGKQCIVVGDSEQIAPESFVDQEKVYRLINDFLYDIPHSERYDPQTSLYAHAEIRYPETVLLNEHFRCMPEIIQFSNDTYYHGKLQCLRQYPPNRLQPIIAYHTPEGYREDNRKTNKTEAEALVNKIVECCSDPKYENLTMGVISLVGSMQAKYIDSLLRQKLDPQEINARNIICGDAYSFQGDERDVMFLSMVADINTGTILTKASDGRRINVAASRAKEQLWIFHSFLPKDMSDASYLQRLLTYSLKPQRSLNKIDYELAQTLFESKFEEDVFNILTDKGYNVQPQFKCAGFRIDLVVSGMKGRIAIECDGDLWHGPDRLEQDMARQRLLERCGWTFWRVRGGDFYLDQEQALDPLWQLLEEFDIKPSFTDEAEDDDTHFEENTDITNTSENIDKSPPPQKTNDRLDAILSYAENQRHVEYSQQILIQAIISSLEICPNLTCTRDSLVSRVCSHLGIVKRAGPRRVFSKLVFKALKTLVQQNKIEEYKAKNDRLRLLE